MNNLIVMSMYFCPQTLKNFIDNSLQMSGGIKQKTVKCVQTVKQDEEVRTHSKTMRYGPLYH